MSEVIRQARFELPPGATQLLLVRHGESAGVDQSQPRPLLGVQADPALAPVGQHEAQLVADRLQSEPIAAIYSSPLRRAADTAAPLGERLGIVPVVEPDLREVFLGDVDGLNLRALAAGGHEGVRQALREERWELLAGAEPIESFRARVKVAIDAIGQRHLGEVVAAFTHGGVIGEVLAIATGSSLHAFIGADNASVTHVIWTPRRWTVRSFNDAGHLRSIVAV